MDIVAEIRTLLAEILDVSPEKVTEESCLIRELGAESIDLLELAAALNARFRIDVNEEDLFLRNVRRRMKEGNHDIPMEFPFLPQERIAEIAADPGGGPVLKVKDVASYVAWQLKKARRHVISR